MCEVPVYEGLCTKVHVYKASRVQRSPCMKLPVCSMCSAHPAVDLEGPTSAEFCAAGCVCE